MIVHTQGPQRGPVPVSSASIALQIPFEQLDPNDSETLKQLAWHRHCYDPSYIRSESGVKCDPTG